MSAVSKAHINGNAFRDMVADMSHSLGLTVQLEVEYGYRKHGGRRKIDIVLTNPKDGKRFGIECKHQSSSGSVFS
jgi:hypothetical protein